MAWQTLTLIIQQYYCDIHPDQCPSVLEIELRISRLDLTVRNWNFATDPTTVVKISDLNLSHGPTGN